MATAPKEPGIALFRPQVTSARGESGYGRPSIGLPPVARRLGQAAAGVLLTGALLLVLGDVPRREIVPGTVVAVEGYATVASPFEGVIEETFVAEGSDVLPGQPLVRLSRRAHDASGGELGQWLISGLEAKRRELEEESQRQAELAGARGRQLEDTIANLSDQLQRLDAQLALRQRQAGIAEEMMGMLEKLSDTRAVSRLELVQQQHRALESIVGLEQLRERRLSLSLELDEARRQLEALPLETANEAGRLEREIADVDNELARQRFDREHVLIAPRAGKVVNLIPGSMRYVTSGQMIAGVLAPDARLAAELWIPSRAMGRIDSNSDVRLRFDAYPSQTFGSYAGRIHGLSATAFSPVEASRLRGQDVAEPVYRAVVEPETLQVRSSRGEHGTLRPGMTLQADLMAERVPLWRWLLGTPAPTLAQAGEGSGP